MSESAPDEADLMTPLDCLSKVNPPGESLLSGDVTPGTLSSSSEMENRGNVSFKAGLRVMPRRRLVLGENSESMGETESTVVVEESADLVFTLCADWTEYVNRISQSIGTSKHQSSCCGSIKGC